MFRTLHQWFRPLIIALTNTTLSWKYRWRLLLLQPLSFLTYTLTTLPWTFSKAYKVHWIPTRSGPIRALIFLPKSKPKTSIPSTSPPNSPTKLRPIHLDIHGGAFIGGLPEYEAHFSSMLCEKAGCVVISTGYRYAPVHTFPAAIDDVDDVLKFVIDNAEEMWGADPHCLTVGGFSAGGNLALAACQKVGLEVKGSVTFYASIDLRLPPWQKPKPPSFPKTDPMAALLPLFDSYASSARETNMSNPRLSPILLTIDRLPEDMLLIIAGIDILLHEQLTFIERVKKDYEEAGVSGERTIEGKVFEKGFHGWLELPFNVSGVDRKEEVFAHAVDFLIGVYRKIGWSYRPGE
ncbi:alpha/beta-hydrolase [Tothia fuscella]|uniref:Alpha/beta-hydrolase n=1 Tax=Tothia fuscella TaxID=1048955 RepID=A0A9P4TU25_9PEZI|nr:alpha/beta-hydrolase [Tothia fuscella]